MSALIHRRLRGMNTTMRLTVRLDEEAPATRDVATRALDQCATWLAACEATCSRFLPTSEVSALNASAGRPMGLSDDLFTVVQLALTFAARFDGVFDPTVLPALHAAGYTRSFEEIGQREIGGRPATDQPAWHGGRWSAVRLDAATRTATLPAGVALDLGGVAKGWAADELARRYLAAFPGYLIDLGGDLRVAGGPEPGRPWIVGVADPREASNTGDAADDEAGAPTYLAGLALTRGGVATSGDARRWWLRAGERQHHIIDPRTGKPATAPLTSQRIATWTALAPTAAEADALAKVAFIRGYEEGMRLLTRGAEAAGVCVHADGRVEATPNLEEYLHESE